METSLVCRELVPGNCLHRSSRTSSLPTGTSIRANPGHAAPRRAVAGALLMEASGDAKCEDGAAPSRPGPLESRTPARSSNLLAVTHPEARRGGKGGEVWHCLRLGLCPFLAQGTCPGQAPQVRLSPPCRVRHYSTAPLNRTLRWAWDAACPRCQLQGRSRDPPCPTPAPFAAPSQPVGSTRDKGRGKQGALQGTGMSWGTERVPAVPVGWGQRAAELAAEAGKIPAQRAGLP